MSDQTVSIDPSGQSADDPNRTSALADHDVTSTDISDPTLVTGPSTSALRYQLKSEIARGGMGAVYRATDISFGREVAVKVLLERFAPTSGTARRFADEARITGRLQHPNIPAVHDLGTLPDGRPFLAMKLINGETLDHLLSARSDATVDRGRFVAVFEQICQAIAYAHAHQIIHRDLKPSNVMVGAFGEVQVMDWGLAKVLGTRDVDSNDRDAMTSDHPNDTDGSYTLAGSILGTPAYMPPEQAAGDSDKVGPRSDVFGLGGILAVILTGHSPFNAGSAETTRVKAASGDMAECFARLDTCGADPELVALCRRCLNPRPEERPADAGEVAQAVAAQRQAADERARQAELDKVRIEGEKAAAEVKLAEGRKRRRVWLGLAGVMAVGLAVAVVLAIQADRSRQAAEVAEKAAHDRRIEAEAAREKEATARQKAEEETQLANAVKDFLQNDILRLADPKTQQQDGHLEYDADVKLRDVVIRAAKLIDGKFTDRPLIESELRGTLGFALHGMGRADLAVPQLERMLTILTGLNRPDHADTLWCMNKLAMCYGAVGRHTDALKLQEETLAIRKAKLGPDHADTLMSTHNLAIRYVAVGRTTEALNLLEETLARMKVKLGPDHFATLSCMSTLANRYAAIGRAAMALKLREETLARMKGKLGADHPSTLWSMHFLASSYASIGKQAEALKLREETLELRKKKLGAEHSDSMNSMLSVIESRIALKQYDTALRETDDLKTLTEKVTTAGKTIDPRIIQGLTFSRLHIFAIQKDAVQCRKTVELYENFGPTEASGYYTAACGRAVLAKLLDGQSEQSRIEADRAIDWLQKAVVAGWRDHLRTSKDSYLEVLRNRDDFKALLADMQSNAVKK